MFKIVINVEGINLSLDQVLRLIKSGRLMVLSTKTFNSISNELENLKKQNSNLLKQNKYLRYENTCLKNNGSKDTVKIKTSEWVQNYKKNKKKDFEVL